MEGNNGIIKWDNKSKRIDINYSGKEISMFADDVEIKDGVTYLSKDFFEKELNLKEKDYYKYLDRYNFRTKIITERNFSWEWTPMSYKTDYEEGKPTISPEEIIDKIKATIYFLEKEIGVKMDISNFSVNIHKGLEYSYGDRIASYMSGGANKFDFYSLSSNNYFDTVIHELGHYIEYTFFSEEDFDNYIKFRGIEDFDNIEWENKPQEVFAEDFSCLFNSNKFNHTNAMTLNEEGLEEFRQMIYNVIKRSGI